MFGGDNGGATATGVTATEIKVALPIAESDTTSKPAFVALVEYMNRHYEFYGRRLVPFFAGAPATATPVDSRASAAAIAAAQVFAATVPNVYEPSLFHELARQRVIAISNPSGFLLDDRTMLDPLHPYLWSTNPSLEDYSRNITDFACTALVGRAAHFAGPDLRATTRSFGVIATGATVLPSTAALVEGFERCGITPKVARLTGSSVTDQHRSALQSFKSAGVTTIVCLCHVNFSSDLNGQAATTVGYRPEWLPMMHTVVDEFYGNAFAKGAPELFQVLQLKPIEKIMPMQARPSFGALLEGGAQLTDPMKQQYIAQRFYAQLSVLAAGIQGAGPNLTPDSFGQGLLAMQFPNTGAGMAPYWQASVGFGPGDHAFFSDYTLSWWDMRMPVYDTSAPADKGSWCYFGQGTRFRPGTYPANATDHFFAPDAPCR